MPILVGLTTNTISRAAVAVMLGRRRYAVGILRGLVFVLLAAWPGWARERLL